LSPGSRNLSILSLPREWWELDRAIFIFLCTPEATPELAAAAMVKEGEHGTQASSGVSDTDAGELKLADLEGLGMIAREPIEGSAVRMDSVSMFTIFFRTGMQDMGTGRGRRGSYVKLVLSEIVFGLPRCKSVGDE
jgi:hypothetical protein